MNSKLKKIKVNLAKDSYEILIGTDIFENVEGYLKNVGLIRTVVIITNPIIKQIYGDRLGEVLSHGFNVHILTIPDGEAYKSIDSAKQLYQQLHDLNVERSTMVLAFGGGVIGDLAGFVAATYLRGLPLVHLPTTLLAQVDSSIGGKVAVDFNKYKNIIGAFYQPKLVVMGISILKTLPEIEIKNGLAEIIKYGIINDSELFVFIDKNLELISKLDSKILQKVIFKSASIKAEVISKDEKDTGLRNILNYGHTIGHAIEAASGFSVKHGYAIAIGMVAAAGISNAMGSFHKVDLDYLSNLITRAGLPKYLSELNSKININEVLEAMNYDKKILSGKVRFVLPKSIGEVFISDKVPLSLVKRMLENN